MRCYFDKTLMYWLLPCLALAIVLGENVDPSLAATIPASLDGTVRYWPLDWDPAANGGAGGDAPFNNNTGSNPRWALSPSGAAGRVVGTGGTAGGTGAPGGSSGRYAGVYVLFFELPSRPAGQVVDTSSALGVYFDSLTGTPPFNVDVWGLGYQATAALDNSHYPDLDGDGDPGAGTSTSLEPAVTPTPSGGLAVNRRIIHFSDTVDMGAGLGIASRMKVFDDLLTTSSPPGYQIGGGAPLAAFMNAVYDAGAVAGDQVVLRLNPDASYAPSTYSARYNLGADDFPTPPAPAQLILNFVAVPEPTTIMLLSGCIGVFMMRRK